jgi:hypothetical protein
MITYMTSTKKRLTPHQKEVYGRLQRLSGNGNRWVPSTLIRCVGACEHLVDKGYALREERSGPRGGTHYFYRSTDGVLPCGCPGQIVADEGHQEGCDLA